MLTFLTLVSIIAGAPRQTQIEGLSKLSNAGRVVWFGNGYERRCERPAAYDHVWTGPETSMEVLQ